MILVPPGVFVDPRHVPCPTPIVNPTFIKHALFQLYLHLATSFLRCLLVFLF